MSPSSEPLEGHPLVETLTGLLRERGETLSCAESCTGGLLSSLITMSPGVSDVFIGAIVAYDNNVKKEWLGVSPALLSSMGAVSLPVAREMALGVRARLKSTWSLSITGIAGPGGGSPQKPVGTVCFGLAGPGIVKVETHLFAGSRREIQMASAERALSMLLEEVMV